MKSRGIAAGASVIALVLSGGAQAGAAGLGDLGQAVGTQTSADVQANAQLGGAQTKAGLDTSQWADAGHGKVNRGGDAAGAVEVKSHAHGLPSVKGRQSVRVGASGHVSPSTASARVKPQAKVRGDSRLAGGGAQVKASARLSAIGDARGPNGTRAKTKAGGRSSVALRANEVHGLGGQRLAKQARHGHFLPLRGIGREVGNPLQLQLAGLLLVLMGALCMGVARLARRRLS